MQPATDRAWRLRAALLLAGGFAFGAAVSLVNSVRALGPLAEVIGVGWSWAALAVLAAAVVGRRPVLIGTASLFLAVVGYYLVDALRGVYTMLDETHPSYLTDPANAPTYLSWSGLLFDIALWASAALVIGPPLSLAGAQLRRTDGLGLACRLVVPLGAAVEMFALRLPSALAFPPTSTAGIATMTSVGVAGVTAAVVLVVLHARRRRSVPRRTD